MRLKPGFDQYALFAVRGHGIDEVDAAQMVAVGAWARPVAALGLGLLGDRFGISRMALLCFVLLIFSHSLFAFTGNAMGTLTLILLNTLVTCIAIFGLRGLYFGLLQEGQIPLAFTGTAVGLVSVLGYAPDIYIAAVAGFLIDRSPGLEGFQPCSCCCWGSRSRGPSPQYSLNGRQKEHRVIARLKPDKKVTVMPAATKMIIRHTS